MLSGSPSHKGSFASDEPHYTCLQIPSAAEALSSFPVVRGSLVTSITHPSTHSLLSVSEDKLPQADFHMRYTSSCICRGLKLPLLHPLTLHPGSTLKCTAWLDCSSTWDSSARIHARECNRSIAEIMLPLLQDVTNRTCAYWAIS